MRWTIAAPFFDDAPAWIDDHAPPGDMSFEKVAPPTIEQDGWHVRRSRGTPLARWFRIWRHAGAASSADGLVTVFPQLAAMANLRRRLRRDRRPIVAWCYNIGQFPTGIRRTLLRTIMRGVDRIVVHSRAEVGLIAELLDTPPGVVQYVPLQRAPIPVLEPEDAEHPFVVAMGSANRDYATLIEAARLTGIPLTIVASPRAMAGIALPDTVTLLSGLTAEQCWRLTQRARYAVVPLADSGAASGQVTVIEAMRMARPVIATRTIGTEDYIEDAVTGLLVPAGDAPALAERMRLLWEDEGLRRDLAGRASEFAERVLSDEAAAGALVRILREAAAGTRTV